VSQPTRPRCELHYCSKQFNMPINNQSTIIFTVPYPQI